MKNEKLLKINLSGVVWQSLEFSLMGFSVIAGIINLNVLIEKKQWFGKSRLIVHIIFINI